MLKKSMIDASAAMRVISMAGEMRSTRSGRRSAVSSSASRRVLQRERAAGGVAADVEGLAGGDPGSDVAGGDAHRRAPVAVAHLDHHRGQGAVPRQTQHGDVETARMQRFGQRLRRVGRVGEAVDEQRLALGPGLCEAEGAVVRGAVDQAVDRAAGVEAAEEIGLVAAVPAGDLVVVLGEELVFAFEVAGEIEVAMAQGGEFLGQTLEMPGVQRRQHGDRVEREAGNDGQTDNAQEPGELESQTPGLFCCAGGQVEERWHQRFSLAKAEAIALPAGAGPVLRCCPQGDLPGARGWLGVFPRPAGALS